MSKRDSSSNEETAKTTAAYLEKRYGIGRPTKYNQETLTRLLDAIELGATNKLACEIAGIHVDTFAEWQNSRPGFSEAITRARAKMGETALALIRKGAHKSPHAAIWLLERTRVDEYGRHALILENPDGTPVQFTETGALAAELRAGGRGELHQLLAKFGGENSLSGVAALPPSEGGGRPDQASGSSAEARRVPRSGARGRTAKADNSSPRPSRKKRAN